MDSPAHFTRKQLNVLGLFLQRPNAEFSGADIMRLAGLQSGSLYPMLYAFEDDGFLTSRWETEEPQALGRPRKRLYRITPLGERAVSADVAALAKLIPSFQAPRAK